MTTVDPFLVPTPDDWRKDPQINEWVFNLQLLLDNLTREGGAIATGETTADTVVTQQQQIDTVEAETDTNTAALAAFLTGLPTYSITNDGTDRTFNADSAAGTITGPNPTQAEVENIRDAVLEIADVLATIIRDLANKSIVGD